MALTYLRKADMNDFEAIWSIVESAKQFLKEQDIDQWQTPDYPNKKVITDLINQQMYYVLITDGQVSGTAYIVLGHDVNYDYLTDSTLDESYGDNHMTIHMISVSDKFRGRHLTSYLMSDFITLAKAHDLHDIRIDTHVDNQIMQHTIEKTGFEKHGMIRQPLYTGYAYQLII
ncbi:GNAT family N-acetyltransferase [Lactobacillus sp. Sy-1]|uniref:GNAT family N-acetyltransferase n=1 Tax=Lactobacillus sp. Sy-1 TaxID=2109645 RepID=UPI001C5AD214|nr:GNAT family N-acetyltransferase [Lactobacillus sp. Sy-1]MBW1605912.1 GNAT family N-acetyltransferase [Lactobacillus sp. Sy-1]